MTDREIFQRNLADLMESTKTKQIDIARYADVSYQTVSAWVCGRGYPRAEAMQKLCSYFSVKLSALTEDHTETDEDRLLDAFHKLSDDGREKLLDRAKELLLLCPKKGKKHG